MGGIGKNLPEIKIKKKEIEKGINILDFLSQNKIMTSKSEARRAIKSNALKLDNIILKEETKIIKNNDFKNNTLKISFGKKKHFLIKII